MARRKQYLDIPDHARRDFIKWSVGIGAALGLKPWKVFEINESIVGPALAQQAACSSVMRFVGNVMGNGGFAWMNQLWPHLEQASKPGAAFYATGRATQQVISGPGDRPFMLAPDAPFAGTGKRVSAFLAGSNETHTTRPISSTTVGTGVGMFAAVAALQAAASPTLVPSIGVGMLPYGTAAGAPAIASVPSPAGMVDLFNSASSTAGGALQAAGDASLFEAYYKANLSLRAAAGRPTVGSGYRTGKVAANLLGKNLASQLRPSADDLARYGITAGTPTKLTDIAQTLITTVKAFKLSLTNAVLLPGMQDDPHGAFADMAGTLSTIQTMGKIWSAFMTDMMAEPDPLCAGAKLGDNLVVTWSGDTPKDPFDPTAWPDGTPGNSNWIYVLSNGWINAGWHGGIKGNGSAVGWNPTTGADDPAGVSSNLAAPAAAAVLYAVAKGDARRVQDFYRGVDYSGVVKAKLS